MQEIIPYSVSHDDDRPLPLIVAEKWNFNLEHTIEQEVYWYSITDWIVGLLETNTIHASKIWNEVKTRSLLDTSVTTRSISHTRKDGRKFVADYTDDKGLYLIAQHLRVNKDRPLLKEIKVFLSKAGVFVDLVRRKPETVIESGAIDPDQAIDAAIAEYKRQGKSEEWINARVFGKLKRATFTAALKQAIADITQEHYRIATDDIYLGLWQRTAKRLREEMSLPAKANLRDHQPLPALFYQALAEDGCARKLGEKEELTWEEARAIVQAIARLIGRQAREYGEYFGIDVATGKPLLPGG